MDIKEKLRILRKRREILAKQKEIEKKWEQLSKQENLSHTEKLEKLIQTKIGKKEVIKNSYEVPELPSKVLVFEHSFPLDYVLGEIPIKYGIELNGKELYYLSQNKDFINLDLSSSLFIDLETTGLSGGTGIIPFLIGLGFYTEEQFMIIQFFLPQPSEEEELINKFSDFLQEMNFKSIITYNGKLFDIPLLETRYILNRKPFSLNFLPHLDLLISARILWGEKYGSCKLSHLSKEILGIFREDDIPSHLVPKIYFNYLKTGDFSCIEPVLYHNEQDLLCLLGLTIIGGHFLKSKELQNKINGIDLFGLSKLFERLKAHRECLEIYEKALKTSIPENFARRIKKKLSYLYKKNREWEKAVSLWEELALSGEAFPLRELAIYYEHRVKDLVKAKNLVEHALKNLNLKSHYKKDFQHRLTRLERKIKKNPNLIFE